MKRYRLRIQYEPHEGGGGKWVAVLLDKDGIEVPGARSPEGTEYEAEQYANNYKRYGAWMKS